MQKLKELKKIKIKRREIRAIEEPEEEVIRYCPHCLNFNFQNKLTQIKQDPNFFVCQFCCRKFGRHEVEIESKLQDIIEPSDNPFDSGHSMVGLGNKRKLTPREKEFKKLRERIDSEKEADIKAELRKGNSVEIIEDS